MRYSDYAYQEFEKIRLVPEVEVVSYDYEDVAGSSGSGLELKVPIEAGTLVLGVGHLITEAFESDIALTIGDSATADGYSVSGNTTLNSLNNVYFSAGGANAFAQGKYYAAANYVKLTFASTPENQGAGKIMIMVVKGFAGNWRVPAV
jgi:hypothetical protein